MIPRLGVSVYALGVITTAASGATLFLGVGPSWLVILPAVGFVVTFIALPITLHEFGSRRMVGGSSGRTSGSSPQDSVGGGGGGETPPIVGTGTGVVQAVPAPQVESPLFESPREMLLFTLMLPLELVVLGAVVALGREWPSVLGIVGIAALLFVLLVLRFGGRAWTRGGHGVLAESLLERESKR